MSHLKLSYNPTPVTGATKFRLLRGSSKTTPEDIECLMDAREQMCKYGNNVEVHTLYRIQPGDYHAVIGPVLKGRTIAEAPALRLVK